MAGADPPYGLPPAADVGEVMGAEVDAELGTAEDGVSEASEASMKRPPFVDVGMTGVADAAAVL